MKYLGIGTCVVLVIAMASYVFQDSTLIYKVAGLIGGMSWIISGVVSGTFIRKDSEPIHMDLQHAHENNQKFNWASTWFLLGLPNIVIAVIVFFIHS